MRNWAINALLLGILLIIIVITIAINALTQTNNILFNIVELASGSESVALAEAFCQSEEKANIDSSLQQLRVNATSHVPSSSACSLATYHFYQTIELTTK